MKVAVIGATGYIGRALSETLRARGHSLRTLARPRGAGKAAPEGDFWPVDVAVRASLLAALEGTDAVVNLAGLTRANRDALYDRVNVRGAGNVARAVTTLGIGRLVHVSHLAAQGPSLDGQAPAAPGHEAPMDAHGRSRLRGEQAVLKHASQAACVLRPAWVTDAEDPQLRRLTALVRRGVAPVVADAQVSFVGRQALCSLIADVLDRAQVAPGPHFVADGAIRVSTLLDVVERNAGGRPALRLPLSTGALAKVVPVAERIAASLGVGQGWGQWLRALTAGSWVCDPSNTASALGFEPDAQVIRQLSEAVRAQS